MDLSKSILHALPRFRILPRQRVTAAGDDAGAAFQAAVVFDVNQAVVAESVDAGRADERAEFDSAFGLAHVMVDRDMTFGINLVSVDAEFSFDINWHRTSERAVWF